MKKTKSLIAIFITIVIIMTNCFTLLSNIVYATETTYTVTFVRANAGDENYHDGDYSVINWLYTEEMQDQNGNPTNVTRRLYARVQKYDSVRNEWINGEGIYSGDSGNQVATFTSEADNVNTEYRIVFDNFLNDYNIFVNGNKITQADYVIDHPYDDDYAIVILNEITNGMSISIDRRQEKRIEFGSSTWKNQNTVTYNINENSVDVQIGKINNEVFEPMNLSNNSNENPDTHQIDVHYEAIFEDSQADLYLKLSGFDSETMDLIINGNQIEVDQNGYVNLAFLEDAGYLQSWVDIWNKNSHQRG